MENKKPFLINDTDIKKVWERDDLESRIVRFLFAPITEHLIKFWKWVRNI